MLHGSPLHQSNDVGMKQNSLFSDNNETLNQSNFNEMGPFNTVGTGSMQHRAGESSVGDIHSLYQDLFLTDIKKEVENAQHELKSCKME